MKLLIILNFCLLLQDYYGAKMVGWNALLLDDYGSDSYTMIKEQNIINNLTEIFER